MQDLFAVRKARADEIGQNEVVNSQAIDLSARRAASRKCGADELAHNDGT
jgi:hypothetical protein